MYRSAIAYFLIQWIIMRIDSKDIRKKYSLILTCKWNLLRLLALIILSISVRFITCSYIWFQSWTTPTQSCGLFWDTLQRNATNSVVVFNNCTCAHEKSYQLIPQPGAQDQGTACLVHDTRHNQQKRWKNELARGKSVGEKRLKGTDCMRLTWEWIIHCILL